MDLVLEGTTNMNKMITTDISGRCRVCMGSEESLTNAFNSRDIVKQIKFCTGILITKEDGLPICLCTSCLANLTIAYKFKRLCLESDKLFKTILRLNQDRKDISHRKIWAKVYVDEHTSIKKQQKSLKKSKNLNISHQKARESEEFCKMDEDNMEKNILENLIQEKMCKVPNRVQKDTNVLNQASSEKTMQFPSDIELGCKQEAVLVPNIESDDQKGFDNSNEDLTLDNLECTEKKPISVNPPQKSKRNKVEKKSKTKRKAVELSCKQCNINFDGKLTMLEHNRDVHGQIWICEVCGKQYLYKSTLYAHMHTHVPPRFRCDKCDYTTQYKTDLDKHDRIHTGVKNYCCEYCPLKFRYTSGLRLHIRSAHEGTLPHECPRCGHSFLTKTKLRLHLDSHDNIKRHECELCHSHFTRRCHWKKHLLKQHNVVIPRVRPGRRKADPVVALDQKPLTPTSLLTSVS